MIYIPGTDDTSAIIILSPGNLQEMQKNRPAVVPDGSAIICFTPDLPWLRDKLTKLIEAGKLDVDKLAELLDEGIKRAPVDESKEPRFPTRWVGKGGVQ